MKLVITVFCWILAAYCIYFPISYFGKDADKKEVAISHILVNTIDEAKQIKKSIEDKEITFEKAAEEKSLCNSAKNKGYLGYLEKGRLKPEIDAVSFKMKKNVLSDPIKTQDGWHIIKIKDITYFSDKKNFNEIDEEYDKLLTQLN